MPRRRLVTDKQYEKLVDFLEQNPCLALGRDSFGPLATQSMSNMWEQVSVTLNRIPDGVAKDGHKWRIFWNELKYKTRKMAAKLEKLNQTEPIERLFRKPLNAIEVRVLGIIGHKTENENEDEGQYELEDEDDESLSSSIPQEMNLKLEYLDVPVEENGDHMQQDDQEEHPHTESNKIQAITVHRPFLMEINGEDPVGLLEHPPSEADTEVQRRQRQIRRQLNLKRQNIIQQADKRNVLKPEHRDRKRPLIQKRCRRPEQKPPKWVLELEERRLATDSRLASALNRLATVLEKMEAKMS